MKKISALKVCAAVLAAVTMLSAVDVKADPAEDARIQKEMSGAQLTAERNYRAAKYAACVEESRIAAQYLGSLETLAGANPLYAGYIEAARQRLAAAKEAEKTAKAALDTALAITEPGKESSDITGGKKQKIGVIDKNGILTESFNVEATGKPSDPSAAIEITDFPKSYLNYEDYSIVARYYSRESLKEVTEVSNTAGKLTGKIEITGEMPTGGYADQVAVEISVEKDHSLIFLWDESGDLRVTDKD